MGFSIVQVEGGLNFNVNINLTSPASEPEAPGHVSAPCDELTSISFTASVHAWCYVVRSDTTSEDQEGDAVKEAAKKAAKKAAHDKVTEWARSFARNIECETENCGEPFIQIVTDPPVLDNFGHNFGHWWYDPWAWADATCTVTVYYGCCDGSETKYRKLVDKLFALKRSHQAEIERRTEERSARRAARTANNESVDPGPPPGREGGEPR